MKVSLAMSVYNGEEYLKETIDSILAQTYSNLEIIIVNDGSTDSTWKILSEINDERVKVIHLDVNKGVANGLNLAIAQAKGDWIAIHDSDDISLPNRIDEQVAYAKSNPHVVAIGSFIECIEGKNISASKIAHMKNLERYKNSIVTWEQIKVDLFKGCPITHGSLLMLKDAYLKAGRYDPQYKIASDYEFFTRISAVGPIENVPKVLYKYRISPNSLSNSNVIETSNEFLIASTRYIKNHCFAYKKSKPAVVVHGTKEGCETFSKIMTNKEIVDVPIILLGFEEEKMKEIDKFYKDGEIDAFIILTNAPDEFKIIRYLEKRGLKLNEDFFTLWSAL